MKRNFKMLAVSTMVACSLLFSSCIGSFSLFNKLLAWNQSVSNKWVNELIFLVISPAYGVATFVDAVVLNTVEFWTGSNPIAGIEIKTIEGKDGIFTVETNKDGHKITKQETGEIVYFHFNETEKTWSIEANGTLTPLMTVIDDQYVMMHLPDGSKMQVSLDKAGVFAFRQVVMNNHYFAAR